jgi:hypothetical protein
MQRVKELVKCVAAKKVEYGCRDGFILVQCFGGKCDLTKLRKVSKVRQQNRAVSRAHKDEGREILNTGKVNGPRLATVLRRRKDSGKF